MEVKTNELISLNIYGFSVLNGTLFFQAEVWSNRSSNLTLNLQSLASRLGEKTNFNYCI